MNPTETKESLHPSPEQSGAAPQAKKAGKPVLLYLFAAVGVLAIIAVCILAAFWAHGAFKNHQKEIAAKRQQTVQQGIIDLLSARTVQQQVRYTDAKYHTTTYRIASDFGDSGFPITKGTITNEYDQSGRHLKQTLQFVAFKGTDQADELYFRMIEGADITGAPTNWYHGLQRDIRSMDAFKNFWWYKYDLINGPNGTLRIGNFWSSDFKDKIIDDIHNNKAYMLTSCDASKVSIWCNGSLNPRGMLDIDHWAGITTWEGRNDAPTNLGNAKFTIWTNNGQTGVSRIIYTQPGLDYTQQNVSHDYWGINKPVDVSKPHNAQDAPILGSFRATIDSPCNALCQADLSSAEAASAAGHYY